MSRAIQIEDGPALSMPSTGEGRTIVVTGASGRLGRVVVRCLHERGFLPVRWVRTPEPVALGGSDVDPAGPPVVCDVTDAGSVERAIEESVLRAGALHGIVHTVGGWATAPMAGHPLDVWNRMIELNLTSTFHIVRAAFGRLAPGATLVAFAARQGVDGGVDGQAAYAAAKGGLVRLIEAAREEAAACGVSVCAVAPSTIRYESDAEGPGIAAEALGRLVVDLIQDGSAFNGAVLRAYGSS